MGSPRGNPASIWTLILIIHLVLLSSEKTRAMLFQGANPQLRDHLFTNGSSSDSTHPSSSGTNGYPQTYSSGTNGYPQTNEACSNGTNGYHQTSETNGSYSNGVQLQAPTGSATCNNELLRYFSNGTNGLSQTGHTHNGRSEIKELTNGHSSLMVCKCCRRKGVRLVTVCIHCEGRVCGKEGCLRECCVCQLRLCQFCTVLK